MGYFYRLNLEVDIEESILHDDVSTLSSLLDLNNVDERRFLASLALAFYINANNTKTYLLNSDYYRNLSCGINHSYECFNIDNGAFYKNVITQKYDFTILNSMIRNKKFNTIVELIDLGADPFILHNGGYDSISIDTGNNISCQLMVNGFSLLMQEIISIFYAQFREVDVINSSFIDKRKIQSCDLLTCDINSIYTFSIDLNLTNIYKALERMVRVTNACDFRNYNFPCRRYSNYGEIVREDSFGSICNTFSDLNRQFQNNIQSQLEYLRPEKQIELYSIVNILNNIQHIV